MRKGWNGERMVYKKIGVRKEMGEEMIVEWKEWSEENDARKEWSRERVKWSKNG